MKKTVLTFTIAMATSVSTLSAQNVSIPDANFKVWLVGNTGINTNSDTEIQVSEAAGFTGSIECAGLNITDPTGIEAFINVTALNFNNNQITSLDVSQNTSLNYLSCNNNQLADLDLSNNTSLLELTCMNNVLTNLNVSACAALTNLTCLNNQLSSLNVSGNAALTSLNCHTNPLTSLDVSQNPDLIALICNNTQITSLDVSQNPELVSFVCNSNSQLSSLNVANGNNPWFTYFQAGFNPNLNCIQIDDADTTGYNWTGFSFFFDQGVTFSNNCATTGLPQIENSQLNIYPNPAQNTLTIETKNAGNFVLSNIIGEALYVQQIQSKAIISLENFSSGIYFLTEVNSGRTTKVIKE